MTGLGERQRKVLFSVTREYIMTRRPVSSRRVLEVTDIDRSGATIRNDMKKLEEMGYLHQPHTSAGRIPTDKALRFYLEEMLKLRDEWKGENLSLNLNPKFPISDLNTILRAIAEILARSAHGLVILTKPDFSRLRVMGIHVTPITKDFAVISAVTELGISNVVPLRMGEKEVGIFRKILRRFSGRTFGEIIDTLEGFKTDDEGLRTVLETLKNVFRILSVGEEFVVRGLAELISEFKGHEIEGVVRLVEDRKEIEEIAEIAKNGVEVFIGSEMGKKELKNFALFVAPYRKGDERMGEVILITSKYTMYEKVYPMVEFVSNRLTEYLTVMSREVV